MPRAMRVRIPSPPFYWPLAMRLAALEQQFRIHSDKVIPVRLAACWNASRSAAMLAGVTDRLWSFEDLFDAVMG